MRVYLRFFWRWLSGVLPTLWYSLTSYHPRFGRHLLSSVVECQVLHWQDFTLACWLRHYAYQYHRRYRASLVRLYKRKGGN